MPNIVDLFGQPYDTSTKGLPSKGSKGEFIVRLFKSAPIVSCSTGALALSLAFSGCQGLGRNLSLRTNTSSITSQYVPVPTYAPALLYAENEVKALTSKNGRLFMGGNFRYVGPYTRSAPAVDLNAGKVISPSIRFNSKSVEPDGSGGYYVGGTRNIYDGSGLYVASGWTPSVGLKHVLADGAIDTGFTLQILGGEVSAIKKVGSVLYIGGNFLEIAGQPRQYLAAVDANTGALLPFRADLQVGGSGYVKALEVSGSTLFVGGEIYSVQPGGTGPWTSVNHLIALDSTTGALQWNSASDGYVLSLKISGTKLFAGGYFSNISAASRNRLAVFDISTPSAPALGIVDPLPVAYDSVTSLAVGTGKIYATGEDATSSPSLTYVAAFNSSSGTLLWNQGAIGTSSFSTSSVAASPDGSRAVLAVNNDSQIDVRSVSPTDGTVSDLSFGAFPYLRVKSNMTTPTISALAYTNSRLVVAGDFQAIVAPRNGAAEIDVDSNVPTAWNPDVGSGQVNAINLASDKIYLGGNFSAVNSGSATPVSRANIAAVNYTTGTDSGWDPGSGPNGQVNQIIVSGSQVAIIGGFSSVDSTTRNQVAVLDSDTGDVDMTIDPGSMLTCQLYTAIASGDDLYISSCASGSPAVFKISLSGAAFPGVMTLGSPAFGLELTDTHLYAMGPFSSVYGTIAKRSLVKVDRSTGQVVPLNAYGFSSGTAALHVSPSGKLFMGTQIYSASQIRPTTSDPTSDWRETMSVVDSSSGALDALNFQLIYGYTVNQFHSIGKTTYMAGSFVARVNYRHPSAGETLFQAPYIVTFKEDLNGNIQFLEP